MMVLNQRGGREGCATCVVNDLVAGACVKSTSSFNVFLCASAAE